MKALFVSIPFVLVMAGCGNLRTAEDVAKDQARAAEIRSKLHDEESKKQQEINNNTLSQVPSWALKPPAADGTGVFAVGLGESADMRIALKKSMLDAEFGLAKQFNQEISGSERSFTQETGKKNASEQYTALIDKLVTQVPVVGFEVVSQEVKSIDGMFHSFVLLKLPYAEFNKVIQQQRSSTTDGQIKRAFDDLERRVKERQAQRLSEAATADTSKRD